MIIWGSGSDTTDLADLGERDCPVCEEKTPFKAILNYTYRHLWYVFSWISKREYYAFCEHCNHGVPIDTSVGKKMFPNDGIPFMRKKGWLVGFALLALLLVWGGIMERQESQASIRFLDAPQVGDVYQADLSRIEGSGFENEDGHAYGLLKLMDIQDNGDAFLFVTSASAWSKKKGASRALKAPPDRTYDWDSPFILSSKDVRELYTRNVIYQITR